MLEHKHSDGTPVHLTLYVNDDIEFQTPAVFDHPNPADLERARVAAAAIEKWADDYEARMESRRERWAAEPWHTLGAYDG